MRILAFFVAMVAFGQTPLKFEVASIKPATRSRPTVIDDAHVSLTYSLANLVMTAYGIGQEFLIIPDWTYKGEWDLQAKLPDGATNAQWHAMLKTLLVERFGLVTHTEMREKTVCVLRLDPNGPRLTPASTDAAVEETGRISKVDGHSVFHSPKMAMDVLATMLRRYVDRMVVIDQTGLEGYFEFTFEVPDLPRRGRGGDDSQIVQPSDPDGVSIFSSLRKAGLILEKRKGPVEHLIVDHVERMPIEN